MPQTLDNRQGFRLSSQQRRLWTVMNGCGAAPRFRTQCVAWLRSRNRPIDAARLEEAFVATLRGHEALRSDFETVAGMSAPLQFVRAEPKSAISRIDLRDTGRDDLSWARFAEFRRAQEEAAGPFTPLLLLGRCASDRVLCALSLPGMMADLASVQTVLREMLANAQADAVAEQPSVLQYADYAEWERQVLASPEAKADAEFWRAIDWRTQGATALPFETESRCAAAFTPEHVVVTLPPALAIGARTFAARHQVSEAAVLLTVLLAYLGRMNPTDNQLVGVAHPARPAPELQDAVGLYAKYLPLLFPTDPAQSFRQAAAKVAADLASGEARQHGFDGTGWLVCGAADDEAGAGLHCLFEYDELPDVFVSGDLSAQVVERSAVHERFRLRIAGRRYGERLLLDLGYDANRLSAEAVALVAAQFKALLSSALADEDRPLGGLDFFSRADATITRALRTPSVGPAQGPLLPAAISAAARQGGETAAVVCGNRTISYAELDRWSDQVAQTLQAAHGVREGAVVAIAADKSVELIVGMVAILKAGGCFLPLDLRLPVERLAFMVRDCGAVLCLHGGAVPDESARFTCPCIRIQECAPCGSAAPALPAIAPESVAYIIYTSGTTGTPKGVAVEHLNVRAYVGGLLAELEPHGCRSYATLTSVATDLGHTAIFAALYSGATLHLVPEAIVSDSAALVAYFAAHEVDCLKTVPSHYRALLDAADGRRVGLVPNKCLLLGGEPCPPSLVARLRELRPETAVINHYGPTETTVGVLMHRIEQSDISAARIPLGVAIGKTTATVVSADGRPSPVGVAGELWIGGPQVARGYINSVELTTEKFCRKGCVAPDLLYRTGDRARWRLDGKIELLGRGDRQVKIRGHRVELREIELALVRLSGVQQAIVMDLELSPGALGLVAFVEGEGTLDEKQTLGALTRTLPDHMVPSALLMYARFPVSGSGKVDRVALKSDATDRSARPTRVAPRDAFEETVCAVFASVLGATDVGVRDDYFKLGGDSIKALQVVHRLRQGGLVLQVVDIFEHRTVGALAAFAARRCDDAAVGGAASVVAPRRFDCDEPELASVAAEIQRATGKSLSEAADLFRLTPTQQGMLFHALYDDGALPYINQGVLEFEGHVDPDRMRTACDQIVAANEMLRSNIFHEGLAVPMQVVWRSGRADFAYADLTAEAGAAELRVRDFEERDRRNRFDLGSHALIRLRLFKTGPRRYTLIVTTHHIVLDGWCMAILARQFLRAYSGALELETPPPYRGYIDWLAAQDSTAATTFWKNYFERAAETPPTRLPHRFGLEAGAKYERVEVKRTLSTPITERISALARGCGVTLSSAIQTAWAIVLQRYIGTERVVFGNVVSGRPPAVEGFDRIVGSFINTVPLLVEVAPAATFRSLATVLQRDFRQCDRFGYLLLPDIQRSADCEAAHFDHLYAFESYASDADVNGITYGGEGGFTVSATRKFGYSNYNLNFMVVPGAELTFDFVINRAVIDETMVAAMAASVEAVLIAAAADPDAAVQTFDILAERERRQMIEEYNATTISYPADVLLHELVEQAASRWPDAPAVVSGEVTLSYHELNERANRLARTMQRRCGLAPGGVVGVFATASADMVVAVLGVLKAGGVYVPLSSDHPVERNRYMLQDSGACLVLADFDRPATDAAMPWIHLKHDDALATAGANLPRVRLPGDLAYIIYTSGTTGRPKGVAIEHRAAVNTLFDVNGRFSIRAGDAVLGVSSLTFDLSVYDVFGILAAGGKLVVPAWEETRAPASWSELIFRHGVTVWNSVPALMQLLIDHVGESSGPAPLPLRVVMLSGDWIPVNLPGQIRTHFPAAQVFSLGGATEASIWSIYYPIERVEAHWPSIPYGRPLGNQTYFVYDAALRPCPLYGEGELYIGGKGLARGYVGDEAKTKSAFVVHPRTGNRLYRTGDLGRHLPGGVIEFRGRRDTQVKINGYRIELGEIEAAFLRHPDVKRAVAEVRAGAGAERRLCAYFESERSIPAETIKALLDRELPRHMIPSVFVQVESWPLTANGKLDRSRLPTPPLAQTERTAAPDAPTSPEQACLLEVLGAVLRRSPIRLDDDFFAIGGDSIKAIQAVSRLRRFGYGLSVADIFRHPRLRDCCERMQPLASRDALVPAVADTPTAALTGDELDEIAQRFR